MALVCTSSGVNSFCTLSLSEEEREEEEKEVEKEKVVEGKRRLWFISRTQLVATGMYDNMADTEMRPHEIGVSSA